MIWLVDFIRGFDNFIYTYDEKSGIIIHVMIGYGIDTCNMLCHIQLGEVRVWLYKSFNKEEI